MRRILVFAAVFGLQTAHAHPSETDALKHLDARLKSQPSQVELHLERAEHLLQLQRPHQALAATRSAGLGSSRAHLLAARAHVQLKAHTAALASLEQAISLNPHSAGARWLRAELFEQAGALPQAEADLVALLRQHPRSAPGAYLRLGRVQSAQGEADKALSTLHSGLQASGAQVLRRALVQTALRHDRPNAALRALPALISASKYPVEGLLMKAQAQERLGQTARATKTLKLALSTAERAFKRRGSPAALALRASAKQALGDAQGAQEDARLALLRAPSNPRAQAVLKAGAR